MSFKIEPVKIEGGYVCPYPNCHGKQYRTKARSKKDIWNHIAMWHDGSKTHARRGQRCTICGLPCRGRIHRRHMQQAPS